MTTRRSTRLVRLALLLLWTVPALANDEALVVHEWGTFTCLQDENGKGIGGINTDDEPVPDFVHNIVPALLIPVSSDQPLLSKSVPRCHTDVTMRLEAHGDIGVTTRNALGKERLIARNRDQQSGHNVMDKVGDGLVIRVDAADPFAVFVLQTGECSPLVHH